MKPLTFVLMLWWFMSIATSPYNVVVTQGPFPTYEECDFMRQWVAVEGIRTSQCWQSPSR